MKPCETEVSSYAVQSHFALHTLFRTISVCVYLALCTLRILGLFFSVFNFTRLQILIVFRYQISTPESQIIISSAIYFFGNFIYTVMILLISLRIILIYEE